MFFISLPSTGADGPWPGLRRLQCDVPVSLAWLFTTEHLRATEKQDPNCVAPCLQREPDSVIRPESCCRVGSVVPLRGEGRNIQRTQRQHPAECRRWVQLSSHNFRQSLQTLPFPPFQRHRQTPGCFPNPSRRLRTRGHASCWAATPPKAWACPTPGFSTGVRWPGILPSPKPVGTVSPWRRWRYSTLGTILAWFGPRYKTTRGFPAAQRSYWLLKVCVRVCVTKSIHHRTISVFAVSL